jgi:hypothetical protein
VLADEDDRHGVEREADEQRPPHGETVGAEREERHVQRDHEDGLHEDEVDPERRPERDVRDARHPVNPHDADEPERRPVEDSRLVRVPALLPRQEGPLPVIDVERVRISDQDRERGARDPGGSEDDCEIAHRATHGREG